MRIVRASEVVFINDNLEKEFLSLDSNNEIKKFIYRAIEDIKQNAFCSIPVPKRLIPREYVQKYGIKNLWKYDLPDGWKKFYSSNILIIWQVTEEQNFLRLVYTITTKNKVEIISVILEWFNHPEYERRFGYK